MHLYLTKLFVAICFLALLSYKDIKTKTVSDKTLLIMLFTGAIFSVFEMQLSSFVGYLLTGGITLAIAALLSLLSKESFGMGDAKLLGVLGFYIGNIYILSVVFCSMLLIFLFSLICLLIKKANLKTQIPFVPFIMGGMIILFSVLI